MREILFRGKAINREDGFNYRSNYKNGDWVYGLITKKYNEKYDLAAEMTNEIGISGIEVDYKTIGQFTGLTDKNGVKIFEGDIVKTYDPDDSPAEVVYDESETQYGIVIDNIYYCLGEHFRGIDLEVVGNIHDNPELIEDGD